MKRVTLLTLLILIHISVSAQYSIFDEIADSTTYKEFENPLRFDDRQVINPITEPDSADISRLEHKSFWRATAETAGFNIGLWAFDRYVQKGHYAYISWNTIKENFKHGFEWDNDHLATNMFAHPYNGSLFYNAGRSNGYNFWQSELFAIGGSAMWEMFMECEYPSTNDIIATPIGGAAIGEVLYRTSDLILDDRRTGANRFGREFAAFLVNPMRGFTRIVTGRAWERRATSGRRFGIPPISLDISLGARLLAMHKENTGARFGTTVELNMEYGDRFATKSKQPYDYFSFLLELQSMKTQPPLSRIEIIGRLLSKELVDKNKINISAGLYQHFDYFDSDTIKRNESKNKLTPCIVPYKLGTPASIGGGAMFRIAPFNTWAINGYCHINGILLAGVLTDFYRDYHRNYNWGSGFSIKSGIDIPLNNNKLLVHLASRYYRIFTWNGYDQDYDWSITPEGKPVNVQGDSSNAYFRHFEAEASYRLTKRLYLTGGLDHYYRKTHYTGLRITQGNITIGEPLITSHQIGLHLRLTYKL